MNANILKQAKLCILRFPHLFWWETDLEAWKQTMKAADWAELAGHESLINCLHFKCIQIVFNVYSLRILIGSEVIIGVIIQITAQ